MAQQEPDAQEGQKAHGIAHPAHLAEVLPPRPPKSAHPHPDDVKDDQERTSPPRKRPRTQAIPRVALSLPIPSTQPSALSPNISTNDWAPSPAISRFPIQPLNQFRGASASIKRPQEVAHFSYDDDHQYKEDESSVNYYCTPQMGADLKEGFGTFRHYEDKTDPHLDSLLCALASRERITGSQEQADFVTWRGMMTKIMTAPFDMFAEFSMFATFHDGTIYIEEDFPARAAQRAQEASRPPPKWQDPKMPDHKMMTYWGYKFETLALIPTPPSETPRDVIDARPDAPVSNYAQHCTRLPNDPIPWIELKTAEALPPNPSNRDILKFERKLLKFWAQSFLLGVPKIIIGWRNKQGILTGVQELETNKIPGMVRRGTHCWDGNTCINFAAALLGWLKGVVTEEGKVYRLSLGKKTGVVELRETKEATGGIVSKAFEEWRKELKGTSGDEK
ncbi:decapping endonuclease targeting mRNA [Didymosphaeria variabile]|uniref:Decapping nuclease n=1 Tax=Didymosphaeria variabile TaxID=1932322 RepID=A0A9W8XM42_9PLEO|nr:decapping endonuclease targeting mRNA [Didymosphaeria variabile]KAJ4353939.1 decapping endonuclease targeting mRNA [Didymosphaeria variabile]